MFNDPVVEKIVIARIGLLLRHPFFGNMATRLKVTDASNWCKTAATDGRHLFYNREFFDSMSNKEIEFVVAHEILHNVFDHINRTEGRDPSIWNIAIDYATNGQLVRDSIGSPPKDIKIFHDRKYYGKSSEQIYDEIFDKSKAIKELGKLLDEHIDWRNDGESENDAKGQSGSGKSSGRPVYSKEEMQKIRDEIREATIASANAAGAGNTPGEVKRLIQQLTEPKMNWRQILRQQIQSTIRNDYTFTRPSRKGWHTSAILPGINFDETIDVTVAIDMSGSISNKQALDFLSEVKGIMEEYKDFKIDVFCFDTRVYNHKVFDPHGGEEIAEYEPMGGGGTDFDCIWDFLKYSEMVPKKLLVFTDMQPYGSWGDSDYCSTVFIGHGTTSIVAPFGETVYYTET